MASSVYVEQLANVEQLVYDGEQLVYGGEQLVYGGEHAASLYGEQLVYV